MIIKPIFTTKYSKNGQNKYVFIVNNKYNKIDIRREISEIFGSQVKTINTMIYYRKDKSKFLKKRMVYGKTKKFKKVIVNFHKNKNIDILNKNYDKIKHMEKYKKQKTLQKIILKK